MADMRPFRAYRPAKGLEREIASLPYDVYSREEAAAVVRENPMSFLAIDRAETQFCPEISAYAPQVYTMAGELLRRRIAEGSFAQEDCPCFYLYQLEMDGRRQTGIGACASVDDYLTGVIKRHENTREDKEADRVRHVEACGFQTGPIFLAYRSEPALRQIVAETQSEEPLCDFRAEDGVIHRMWVIRSLEVIERIRRIFGSMEKIYIADGHHRCASAVQVALERRRRRPDCGGAEEFNYFMAVLFPDDELRILDYNRVVKDLNGLSAEEFLRRTGERFQVSLVGKAPWRPTEKGSFGMYLDGEWYRLQAREELRCKDPVDGLDVAVLQNGLLEPVLGIRDPRTDPRIDFVGGIRGLRELERRVHTDMAAAFSLYPTSVEELFAVADAGRLMPPKSTWFEPKLRSGLLLHSIGDSGEGGEKI